MNYNKKYLKSLIVIVFAISTVICSNVTLLVTTNIRGKTEPCGWPKNPRGGLARKATIVDQLYNEGIEPIILDAGNLFFWDKNIDPGISMAVAKIDAEILVDSYNIIGCDAFSPGVSDFSGGLKFLLNLQKKSKFDYISANIYKDNKLLFKPYKIIKNNNKKIAVIGLTSEFNSSEIDIMNPIDTLNDILKDLKGKTDIIILLFNANQNDLDKIYKTNPEIDIIFKSGIDRKHKHVSPDGGKNIPTFFAGEQGKIVYQFDLFQEDKNLPFIDTQWCENEIKNMNSLLNKMKQGDLSIDLLDFYKNDIQTLNKIKSRYSRIEYANNRLANVINSINYKKISLTKNVLDKTRIAKIVDTGNRKKIELEGALQGPVLPN